MKGPEKIYVDSKAIGDNISTTVHTKRQDYPTCTEYTRTDVSVEKAQLFLIDKLKEIPMGGGKMKIKAECSLEEFIENFKNYMKGE